MVVSILAVDPQPIVRIGIRCVAERADDIECVSEHAGGTDLPEVVRRNEVAVVVLGPSVRTPHAGQTVASVRRAEPEVGVLVVGSAASVADVGAVVRAGGGFVGPDAAATEVVTAIRTVARGASYLSPEIAADLVAERSAPEAGDSLSSREEQVLRFLTNGGTVAEIARRLELSPKTVSTYKSRLCRKLALRSTADLIRFGVERGMVAR